MTYCPECGRKMEQLDHDTDTPNYWCKTCKQMWQWNPYAAGDYGGYLATQTIPSVLRKMNERKQRRMND